MCVLGIIYISPWSDLAFCPVHKFGGFFEISFSYKKNTPKCPIFFHLCWQPFILCVYWYSEKLVSLWECASCHVGGRRLTTSPSPPFIWFCLPAGFHPQPASPWQTESLWKIPAARPVADTVFHPGAFSFREFVDGFDKQTDRQTNKSTKKYHVRLFFWCGTPQFEDWGIE